MKKIICIMLALLMVLGTCTLAVSAADEKASINYKDVNYMVENMLYVHAVLGNDAEQDAWQHWQNLDLYRDYDEDEQHDLGVKREDGISKEKYFFLPTSADTKKVVILNTFSKDVTIGDVTIPAGKTAEIEYNTTDDFMVKADGKDYTLRFRKSYAEIAVYINNPDADGNGTDLLSYLSQDKENDAKATGAVVDSEGNIDSTPIKKIKGRGNTTWQKEKKPFNVTYDSAISMDGMEKTKKYSFLANYQDSTLVRNRVLQDLADAVGLPYSSDSKSADFYMNGEYLGSYQVTQKVDVGKNDLVKVIDDETHLNEDGTLKTDFPFLVEIDAGAGDDDYHTYSSKGKCNLTVKGPELDEDDPYYNTVLNVVKTKFDKMYEAVRTDSDNLSDLLDIDSFTKLLLINELSKNWDVGISSFYLTYQADENGNYKFFGSPCWDYDNSIGNATGVKSDLKGMGVKDYEEPTGWWAQYKLNGWGSGKSGKYTLPGYGARNKTIMKRAAEIWFEEFVPALETLNSENVTEGEILSADVYYSYLESSANMNYEIGWRINTGDWICDHSNLILGTYDSKTGEYKADKTATKYAVATYRGEFDYMLGWLNTRAAWLSSQFHSEGNASLILGDPDLNGTVNIKDATLIQKYSAKMVTLTENQISCGNVNGDTTLNVKDATTIQKFAANYKVEYLIGEVLAK